MNSPEPGRAYACQFGKTPSWPGIKARSAAGPRPTSPREGALQQLRSELPLQANESHKSR